MHTTNHHEAMSAAGVKIDAGHRVCHDLFGIKQGCRGVLRQLGQCILLVNLFPNSGHLTPFTVPGVT